MNKTPSNKHLSGEILSMFQPNICILSCIYVALFLFKEPMGQYNDASKSEHRALTIGTDFIDVVGATISSIW